MREWKETKLIQIGNIVSGGTPSTAIPEYWNGDILFVTPNDLSKNNSAYIEKTERKISKDGLTNSSANLLPIGSIVISSRAPIGYFAIAKKELTTNQGCKSVIPKPNFDSLFLYYCLNFYVERIKRLGAGSTFAEISKGDLELVKFPHPNNKSTQRKIAHILSTADAVIEKTKAAIAKYKAIKQGMLHDLFTRGIDPATGKLRPKYQDAPHLYKPSKLGWIPKEWEIKEIIDLTMNGLKNGYFKKPEYVGWGYKLINVTDLYQPFDIDIHQKSVERVFVNAEDYKKYEVKIGDIFFTRSSLVLEGIAHCNIILNLPEKAVWECHVVRCRPNMQKIYPEYLNYYCKTNESRLFFMSIAKQVTMTTISQPDISKLLVSFPTEINERTFK